VEHKVGKYSITFKDDLLLISEDQSVVAFFRAPHVISTIGTAGERIGVGCKIGEVLQPYETETMSAFISRHSSSSLCSFFLIVPL
jgi:hypothetical protein